MENIQILLELPRTALSTFCTTPDEFAVEMRRSAAAFWYDRRLISHAIAAQIAGMSRAEFFDILYRYEVSPFQYDASEIIGELMENL